MSVAVPSLPLSQFDLARFTKFGQKGGIGKGRALRDRLAQSQDELMFLENDELTILLLVDPTNITGLPANLQNERGLALAFCEDIVGLVRVTDVKLTTRLKRPIVSSHKRHESDALEIPVLPEDDTTVVFGSPTKSDKTLSPAMSTSTSDASFASSMQSTSTRSTSPEHSPRHSDESSTEAGVTVFRGQAVPEKHVAFRSNESYFDIASAKHTVDRGSPSETATSSSLDTPGIDRLLDVYAKQEDSPEQRRPVTGASVSSKQQMSRTSQLFAAESLGRMLLDDDMSMMSGSSGTLSPQYERKPAPSIAARSFLDTTQTPDERVLHRVSPEADESPRSGLANVAPLRTSRLHPLPAQDLVSTARPPGSPPLSRLRAGTTSGQAVDAPQPHLMLRSRSSTFSETLSHRLGGPSRQPPPPVHIATSQLAALQAMSEPSPVMSSSSANSSPRPSHSPSLSVGPSATQGAMATLHARAPLFSSSSSASNASPIVRSPSCSSIGEPILGSPIKPSQSKFKGVAWSPKSSRRSGSSGGSARPTTDATPGVQKIGNIEFEFVTAGSLNARRSFESLSSMQKSAEEELLDTELVWRASPEERRALRASMLLLEQQPKASIEKSSFSQSGESLGSPVAPERGSSLRDISSPMVSANDFRSLDSHRTRELAFVELLGRPVAQVKNSKKLKTMVRAGIVSSVRGKAWLWLAEADSLRQVGLFHALCNQESAVHEEIDSHLSACVPPHSLFASSDSPARVDLVTIVKAFACFAPEIGFNRSLAYIAGVLLLQSPAEDVFWLLVAITQRIMPGFYDRDQLTLRGFAFVSGHLLAGAEPELVNKLAKAKVHPHEWTTAWIASLFCKCLPFECLLRVLDCFFLEGPKILATAPQGVYDLIASPQHTGLSLPHELLAAAFAIKIKDGQLRRAFDRLVCLCNTVRMHRLTTQSRDPDAPIEMMPRRIRTHDDAFSLVCYL